MPKISVLIPAFNAQDYIRTTVHSVLTQSYSDLEVVVVDDGSTDGTLNILHEMVADDARLRVVQHEENCGRHSARKTAVEHAKGDYIMFVDADDELLPRIVETLALLVTSAGTPMDEHDPLTGENMPVDMIRYGLDLVPESDSESIAAYHYERMFNASVGDLFGKQVLLASFSEDMPVWVPWNVHTTLYHSSIAKRAFSLMPYARLNRIEDAYEYLVLCACASKRLDYSFLHGYRYHFGRGISSLQQQDIAQFRHDQLSIFEVAEAIEAFIAQYPATDIAESGDDNEARVTQGDLYRAREYFVRHAKGTIYHDLSHRVLREERGKALEAIAQTWGEGIAYEMLLDLIIDESHHYHEGYFPTYASYFSTLRRILARSSRWASRDNNLDLVGQSSVENLFAKEEEVSRILALFDERKEEEAVRLKVEEMAYVYRLHEEQKKQEELHHAHLRGFSSTVTSNFKDIVRFRRS